ncbi:MAG: hypothetical protein FWC73_05100 [Defluviitaleaceae bacterium]|nr:hypothetical protein [Defluviitaleaceae bacterium]
MAKEKIGFEQFMEAVADTDKSFIKDLHEYLIEQGCKATYEEKKIGYLASYKWGKPPRTIINFVFRKQGMLTRIYGENISQYPDFINNLSEKMIGSIRDAGDCKRLIHNTCSPKCSGYDFLIGSEHFQKCRYNCFEFLVSEENNPHIMAFIENELNQRKTT